MKKTFLLFTLSLLLVGLAWGQGLETFDNMPETGSSYSDGTFLGQDGSTWTYVQCRSDFDVTGNSCMLGRDRDPQANVYSGTISGGIGTLSFNYMQVYSTNVNLNVLVNDIVVGNVTSSAEQNVIKNSGTITVNVPGDFVIKFINANNGDGQVCVDDITWSGYAGNPTAATPEITPGTGNFYEAFDATITCSTAGASIYYTTDGTDPTDASTPYAGPVNITDTTTLKAIAYADGYDPSLIAEAVYTFIDPAITTLPYNETFDADLGDCYVYSVSGDTKEWTWRYDQSAYMNGYNSGDTEEDWLILPGMDLDAYGDARMYFDTWYNYGIMDDLNYLKLYYSTDYAGYGDPTLATWTELAFTYPTSSSTWTSSGMVDLTGITGSFVHLGFKYLYEPGNYRSWEIDNILVEEIPANLPPVIANIVQTPEVVVMSTDTVSVSAEITDADGTVSLAQLQWGTETGVYPNTINMTLGTGDTYTTDTDIPAQLDGTTVYYVVYAEDDLLAGATSAEFDYTVTDPAMTTIPYSETFDADLGDCYVYSVSGDTKYWEWSSYNCAYMNGYNSGDIEEDWLILPGIDFTAYGDLQMSFETWYNYGLLDDFNYLKLYYSTDYMGIGDPTLATWTELAFTYPSGSYAWTPSGLIDLSGITGTSVWFGFKYLYEPGNYRTWEVDDILIQEAPLDPIIYASTDMLSGFTYEFGNGPSAEQDFTVSGANLTGDVTLTAPADYELALVSGGPFAASQALTPVDGTVAETTIYVRLLAGLAIGTYNDELIDISSVGATSLTVTLNGEVTSPPPPEEPIALPGTDIDSESFMAHWDPVTGATGYYLDVYTIEPAIATDLFFSEYIEGGSNNKALEIYNGTGADVDLTDYTVELYSNGSSTVGNTLEMEGILADGDVYVIANPSAVTEIQNVADVTSTVTYYNGDDALAILKESTASHVDIFGCIGEDPGSAWVSGDHSTVNKTLVRKSTVTGGVVTNPATGFPTLETEWDVYPQDTFDYLGAHSTGAIVYVPGYENLYVGNVTSYPVTGLEPNTTYYYVVRAANDYGTGEDSNEIAVTTEVGVTPVELSSFSATTTAESFVRLTWTTQSESQLVGYRVYRNISNDQSASSVIDHPLIPATNTSTIQTYSAIDEDVEIGTTYYYWLESVDYNSSDFHGPVSVMVEGNVPPVLPTVTSMKNAYPNPFKAPGSTNIEVSLKAGETGIITIYNISGQVVKTINVSEGNHVIPWNGLDSNGKTCGSGIYFYKLRTPSYSQIYKMVIMK